MPTITGGKSEKGRRVSRAGFTNRLSRLKPRASEKMGGLAENKGPHEEQRRPFFCFQ